MCNVSNIRGEIWLKAAINSAINPVAAFHNINNGKLKDERYWIIVKEILKESVRVAVSKGIKLPQNPLEATEKIIENTPENLCSMLQDLNKGQKTEINEINGLIVKIAREKNLPARLNSEYLKKIKSTS
jgi:2-dehydropantoate 2-reductase